MRRSLNPSPLAAIDARKAMTAWRYSASLIFRRRLRKVAVLMQDISDFMFRYGTPVITSGIKPEGLPNAIYTVLPELQSQAQEKACLARATTDPLGFDVKLNQIPKEWDQVAARFRKENGTHNSNKE